MSDFHVIPGAVIKDILDAQAHTMVARVEQVYLQHHDGRTLNPDSYFLRFPQQPANRIIALPASLEGEEAVAGIKWISSFPGNIAQHKPRASAVVILNHRDTGYPYACLEGAQISVGGVWGLLAQWSVAKGRNGRVHRCRGDCPQYRADAGGGGLGNRRCGGPRFRRGIDPGADRLYRTDRLMHSPRRCTGRGVIC
jgi:hypothetical protein